MLRLTNPIKKYEYKFNKEIKTLNDLNNLSNTLSNVIYSKRIDDADPIDILSVDLKDSDIVFAKNYKLNAKDVFYKYGRISFDNFNKIFTNNDENIFEVCTGMRNKYSKFLIDIDNKITVDENDIKTIEQHRIKHDATIKMLLTDLIIFIKSFANIDIILEDFLITNSNGYENGKIIFSNHIIIPVILKWTNSNHFYKILYDGVFHKYAITNGINFIDNRVYVVKNQNYRMLNQTKINSIRTKISNVPTANISDYLVMIYDDKVLNKYPNINKYIESFISNYKTDTIKPNIIHHKKEHHNVKVFSPISQITHDDLLNTDKYTYILGNIPNNINVIGYTEWFNIVAMSFGYYTTATKDIIIKNNPYKYSLNPKTFENHIISALYHWTNSAYIKTPPNYIKHSNDVLVKLIKSKGLKGYSNKSKEELILMLKSVDNFDYTHENIGDIDTHSKNVITLWNSLKQNQNAIKLFYNKHKRDFSMLEYIASEYNKDLTKNWLLYNTLPALTELNNQVFYDKREYPDYKSTTFYKETMGYKYISLQAIMGKGKTDIVINFLAQCPTEKILVISPRLTLSNATKSRYNNDFSILGEKYNFSLYTDAKNDKNFFNDPDKINRLIISPESIFKIKKSLVKYDIIILDELDTLCYSLDSPTCKQQGLYDLRINSFYHHIKHASKVIYAEAIPSLATVSIMKDLINIENKNKIELEVYLTEPIQNFGLIYPLKPFLHYKDRNFKINVNKFLISMLEEHTELKMISPNVYKITFNPNSISSSSLINTLSYIGIKSNICACITQEIRFKQKYILKSSYNSCSTQANQMLFLKDLVKDLNKGYNINAFVSSAKFLKYIKDHLDKRNIKNVIIHADNKNEMNKYLENKGVLLEQEKIQFFGFTSTLAVGFSQESKNYWKCKYIYYSNFGNITDGCISSSIALQAGYRCRYTMDNDTEQITNVYLQHITNTENNISTNTNTIAINNQKNIKITKENINIFNNIDTIHNDIETLDLSQIEKLNEFIIFNDKYNNRKISRVLTENNEYIYTDNNKTFTISIKLLNQYKRSGLIFNEDLTKLTTNLKNNIKLINNYDNKYFENTIKSKVLFQTNEWDDENTIRSFKECKKQPDECSTEILNNENERLTEEQSNIINEYTNEELHNDKTKRDQYIYYYNEALILISRKDMEEHDYSMTDDFDPTTDKDYYKYLNSKNEYDDPIHDLDKKRLISNTFSIYNYIKCDKLNFNIDKTSIKLIDVLITHFHKYNHVSSNINNFELKTNIINWLFEYFIDLTIFKKDFTTCKISSIVIDENKKVIDKHYYDYINVYNLKSRRDEKTVSKLNFIITDIFGINININVEEKRIYINKVRTRVREYHLDIIPIEYKTLIKQQHAIHNAKMTKLIFISILNQFSYDIRCSTQDIEIERLPIKSIKNKDINYNIDIDNNNDIYYTNEPDDYNEFLYLKYKNIRLFEVEDIKRYRALVKKYLYYKPTQQKNIVSPIATITQPIIKITSLNKNDKLNTADAIELKNIKSNNYILTSSQYYKYQNYLTASPIKIIKNH